MNLLRKISKWVIQTIIVLKVFGFITATRANHFSKRYHNIECEWSPTKAPLYLTLKELNLNIRCPPKVIEQNKIFSHNFKKCVNLKCPLQTVWIKDQAQRNAGPDLRSILFDTQHQFLLKTGCSVGHYVEKKAPVCTAW